MKYFRTINFVTDHRIPIGVCVERLMANKMKKEASLRKRNEMNSIYCYVDVMHGMKSICMVTYKYGVRTYEYTMHCIMITMIWNDAVFFKMRR